MAKYDPTSIIRASIFLAFLSISLFAVFLSCKDRCLFYDFADNYWLPLWVGILGMFLGFFGVAMGCSKRSPPCVGTVFCEFIFVFTLACLGCLLIITRPILALYNHLPNIQIGINITYVTDLAHRNLTAIEDVDAKYVASFIRWGVLAGLSLCLAFLSLCMTCMYCCCCQEESRPARQPKTNAKTNKKENKGKQTNSRERTELNIIGQISSPSTARDPPYVPSLSGNTSKDVSLFPNASAPHFTTSDTLARDYIESQGTSSGNSVQHRVRNTRVHTPQQHADTPPEVPTSPRPSLTKNGQTSSHDRQDDDDGYILPNNPATPSAEAYLLRHPAAPGEYIQPIAGDENYEQLHDYNYAYDHDVEELARSNGTAKETHNSVSKAENTRTETIRNITKDDSLDEYNYPYEHEIEALARNQGSNVTYY